MPEVIPIELPLAAAVGFAHGAVEVIARDAGVDLLHIKGPAIDSALSVTRTADGTFAPRERRSIDADVWVRPAHAERLIAAMLAHGWSVYAPVRWGASFEHAATLTHPGFVSVDIHQTFPGVAAGIDAFEGLWAGRHAAVIAGIVCQVPSLTAQRLILLLHTARNGPDRADVPGAWGTADEAEREDVWALARTWGAEVPLAAAVGELERFADRREHDMWAYLSTGTGTWAQQWWARLRAERNPLRGLGRALRMAFPSRTGMERREGGRLGTVGLFRAYWRRLVRAIRPAEGRGRP